MAKSKKSTALKKGDEVAFIELSKPEVVHNRKRPPRVEIKTNSQKKAQDYYYAKQERILAQKKKHREELKSGKRVTEHKTKVIKNKNGKPERRKLTEEERQANIRQSKHNHYVNNKDNINEKRRQQVEKKKAEKAKKIIDEWNELYG
jgi:hypothetical protein